MSYRVLVVDDSKLARMSLTAALGRLRPDWRYVEAAGSDQALKTLASEPLDIALIDFNMPGTNGLKLATAMRQMRPDMPIAIVSANIQTEIVTRAKALQVAFVTKPITDDALEAFLSGASLRLRKTTR
jgi:CheY-like chemotaxis protein